MSVITASSSCQALLGAPPVLDGHRRIVPAVCAAVVDSDAVAAEFDVLRGVVGEREVLDDTDGHLECVEFATLNLGAAGVSRGGANGSVDDGVAKLVVCLIRSRTATEATAPACRTQPDERTSSVVERVTHTPRIFALSAFDEGSYQSSTARA
jgi:hypothetical protein